MGFSSFVTCNRCGETFDRSGKKGRLCEKCKRVRDKEYQQRRKRREDHLPSLEEKECPRCRQRFIPTTRRNNLCCPDCNSAKRYKNRWIIFNRDAFTCIYCGKTTTDSEWHVDHVIPVKRGGTDTAGNLVTSCVRCNLEKFTTVLVGKSKEYVQGEIRRRNSQYNIPEDTRIRIHVER